jgi:hypothetical protein
MDLHLPKPTTLMALIDSGAGGNFIDEETVKQLQLTRTELRRPIAVRNVDGSHNNNGHITHRTIFDATIARKRQTLSLLITGLGKQPIILGLPWLIKENPDIDWTNGHLQWRNATLTAIRDDTAKKGGNFPRIPYLFDRTLDPRDPFLISLIETFEEPTIPADESSLDILRIKISDHFNQIYGKPETKQSHKELVPKLYHQFIDLFDKKTSERFPKPRPYDSVQRVYFPDVSVQTIKRALRAEGLGAHIRRLVPFITHKNLHV